MSISTINSSIAVAQKTENRTTNERKNDRKEVRLLWKEKERHSEKESSPSKAADFYLGRKT
jgi:hypothetical protein